MDGRSYIRSESGQSTTTACSWPYGFWRTNSKNSVVPIDAKRVWSVVMATLSMFMMPSLLLCARNSSMVRRSRTRSSLSRCIDCNNIQKEYSFSWKPTVQRANQLTQLNMPCALTPSIQGSTRFSHTRRTEGWVDLAVGQDCLQPRLSTDNQPFK